MLELLLFKGVNINSKDFWYLRMIILYFINIIDKKERKRKWKNKTPLHYAAQNNSKEIAEFLILKGADINAKNILYQNLNLLFWYKVIFN